MARLLLNLRSRRLYWYWRLLLVVLLLRHVVHRRVAIWHVRLLRLGLVMVIKLSIIRVLKRLLLRGLELLWKLVLVRRLEVLRKLTHIAGLIIGSMVLILIIIMPLMCTCWLCTCP